MVFLSMFIDPFIEFSFMRRALAATFALSLAAGPLGVFLILRRLSLMGDALSHAILPGVAVGFLVAGISLPAMLIGGVLTGLLVAFFSGWVARMTPLREDTSFATFYLISLGLGVLLVSIRGSQMDLMHMLFGSVLGLNNAALYTVASVSSATLITLAIIYRPLVMDSIDPQFQRVFVRASWWSHMLFLTLLVVTLVAGFRVLGTLMVVGLMILPAATARFFAQGAIPQLVLSAVVAVSASFIGLLFSYYFNAPSSAAIILTAGVFYFIALFFGPYGGLNEKIRNKRKRRHQVLLSAWVGLCVLLFTDQTGLAKQNLAPAEPLQVVTSFPILANFIEAVGGEHVEVRTLINEQSNAHHFEPRAQDMQTLVNADLFVLNGAGFEPWWEQLVEAANYQGPVIMATKGLALRRLDNYADEGIFQLQAKTTVFDPHAWLRVDYARHYVHEIYQALAAMLPASAQGQLFTNYQNYDRQLAKLHEELLATFGRNKKACVGVVIAHDALFYFQQAYQCPYFIPLESFNLDAELSAGGFAQTIQHINAQKVQAAVGEYGVDRRLIEQVVRETGIVLGGDLLIETFAQEKNIENYLAMMRWNQKVLKQVLGL